jgi:hypothetical protein
MMASELYGGCLQSSTASLNRQPDVLIKPYLSYVAFRVIGMRTSMSLFCAIHEVLYFNHVAYVTREWRFYHVHHEDEGGI